MKDLLKELTSKVEKIIESMTKKKLNVLQQKQNTNKKNTVRLFIRKEYVFYKRT